MSTHIEAKLGEIAKTVIMPGDPRRATFIAENYLKDYKLVSSVRNIYAYTGFYKGKQVTIMASGMGMPSIGIYSYELYKFYNVENIIRVGTAGSYVPNLKLYDVLLVTDSYTDSSFAKVQSGSDENNLKSSDIINSKIIKKANELEITLNQGTIYSSDVFYKENDNYQQIVENNHCIACEMESFALFHNAKTLNKNAACLLTISDSLITKEETSAEEREKKFTTMIELALESAIEL